jgi:hypothetical protein
MNRIFSIGCAAGALVTTALAQTPRPQLNEAVLRQAQSAQQNQLATAKISGSFADGQEAPQLYPGESADVGPQYLMLSKPRRRWLEASTDVQFYYTSNVFLSEKGAVDTGVLLMTAQAAFAPEPFAVGGGELALKAGYREQMYLYGLDDTANQLNNLDFDVATVFASARYGFGQNWTAYLELDYNRYLSHEEHWTEFYTEVAPTWVLERKFELGANQIFSASYAGTAHWTYTDAPSNINDRIDSILALSWSWQFFPRWILQPSYRIQHTYYWQNSDRNDFFHTLGLSVAWLVNDWASVRTFATWEARVSNDPDVSDYQKTDAGLGLSVALRF